MADDAILVVDGGDFVATASYIVRPPRRYRGSIPACSARSASAAASRSAPRSCAGPRGLATSGAMSSAYTLAEFDSYVRHGVAPIALIGNDASWMQIAREQVEVLGTSLGTDLRRSDYTRSRRATAASGSC